MEHISWLRLRDILGAHTMVIEFSGGSDGVRDIGLLESALAHPQNIHAYEPEAPITRLAAAYGFGIASNDPFVDGNKRAAFIAIELFLDLHDIRVEASEEEEYVTMMALASGELDEAGLSEWLSKHTALPPGAK